MLVREKQTHLLHNPTNNERWEQTQHKCLSSTAHVGEREGCITWVPLSHSPARRLWACDEQFGFLRH